MQVNEWDSRRIDEPAYEVRQEGYAAAGALLTTSETWTLDSVLPLLYSAIFTLNTVCDAAAMTNWVCHCLLLFVCCLQSEEMSLRDAASSFITRVLSHTQTKG